MYRRAAGENYVLPGYNPVVALIEKPGIGREEARWFEVHEAALILEAPRAHKQSRVDGVTGVYPLVATFLLTGARQTEVLGLEVEDVSFDRKTITFRPNRWRRLKTRNAHRSVPLCPQLEEILREHVYGGDMPRVSGLLFPSVRPSKPAEQRRTSRAQAQLRASPTIASEASIRRSPVCCSDTLDGRTIR